MSTGSRSTAQGTTEVLLVGGRSGVGKTSVGYEVSSVLQRAGVAHSHVEGDTLDAAYPKPVDDPHGTRLTEVNLRALWATYAALGHDRLVFTNTVSVLEAAMVTRAVGGARRVHGVLLTGSDEVVAQRLARRESGSALMAHLDRSAVMARHLEHTVEPWVVRVPTDARTVADVAADVLAATGWLGPPTPGPVH